MPSYDERTPSGWPLPFRSNTLEFDVERLRASFLAVDEALQVLKDRFSDLLDKKYYGLEERQYILDERMDVIAGQTTEDSEILDARVDAKGVTHPNVGHNVRTLHNTVIDLAHAVKQDIQDLDAVLKQLNELAYANIQGSLNAQAAHQKNHERITQEALIRKEQDEILQGQVHELSEGSIQQSISLSREAAQRRKDTSIVHERINAETQQRLAGDALLQAQADDLANDDAALQRQADSLAQASIRTSLTVQALSTQQKTETQQRISADDALNAQADELAAASIQQSLNLGREADQRRKDTSIVHERIDAETQQRLAGDALLQAQADDLANDDAALQRQADSLAQASIRTSLTVQALSTQQKTETQQRISADDALNAQADELAAASIQQSLNLEREAAQRRKEILSEVQAREAGDALEANIRAEKDSDLQAQIAELHINNNISTQTGDQQLQLLSLAVLKNTLMQRDAHEKSKAEILHEALSRSEREDYLQSQIDNLAFAIMQVALNDYSARERFRQSIDEFYQAMADSGNMTYMGAKVASGNEINEMLTDVLSGTDSGAVSISEIPEALRSRVATSSEVSEMLAEIFNPNN